MPSPLSAMVFLSFPLKAVTGTIQVVTSSKRQGRSHSNQVALLYLCMFVGDGGNGNLTIFPSKEFS